MQTSDENESNDYKLIPYQILQTNIYNENRLAYSKENY